MPARSQRVPLQLSAFALFKERWKECTACHLSEGRTKVVLSRGTYPCELLFIGEAPGACITGDTLIDTAFRDKSIFPDGVPIKSLVGTSGFYVYSYDVDNRSITLGKVNRVWRTGYRKVYKVTYWWWGAPPEGKGGRVKYSNSITVTDNHPFLMVNGRYKSILDGLRVGDSLLPFYRHAVRRNGYSRYRIGTHSIHDMRTEAVFLLENKLGRRLEENEQAHHDDRNPSNDSWENLICLDVVEHARLHGIEDNAMFNPVHRETHRKSVLEEEYRRGQSERMSKHLSNPDNYKRRIDQIHRQSSETSKTLKHKHRTDPEFYLNYLRSWRGRNSRRFSQEENHEICSIEYVGIREVFDMEIEKYNNFATGGIFVHNSEDAIGRPFCGPAGQLLDHIIQNSVSRDITYAFTNLVCCIPRGDDGKKVHEPDDDAVRACSTRLKEFVEICDPNLIVCVGKLAEDWLDTRYRDSIQLHKKIPLVKITHPAAILRKNIAMRGLEVQRAEITVRNAIEDYLRRE